MYAGARGLYRDLSARERGLCTAMPSVPARTNDRTAVQAQREAGARNSKEI